MLCEVVGELAAVPRVAAYGSRLGLFASSPTNLSSTPHCTAFGLRKAFSYFASFPSPLPALYPWIIGAKLLPSSHCGAGILLVCFFPDRLLSNTRAPLVRGDISLIASSGCGQVTTIKSYAAQTIVIELRRSAHFSRHASCVLRLLLVVYLLIARISTTPDLASSRDILVARDLGTASLRSARRVDFWLRHSETASLKSLAIMQVPPALSNFLTSSYQQYKEDTNTVASWLATTARSCGYPEDLLLNRNTADTQKSGTQTTGRLKGKARKEAKQAASSASTTASGATQKPAYVIAIKDFICLAEFIAAKRKPRPKVPPYFSETLDRAISVRTKHGTIAGTKPDSDGSNKRHSFFVGILERVREVLTPILPPKSTKKERSSADTPVDDFSNRFTTLNVEEPSQKFLDAPDVVIPERPLPDFEAEQLEDLNEMATALALLIEDLRSIRQVVDNLWVCYKFGQYDLIAVSLVTNTAVDFARSLENDMSALLKKYGGAGAQLTRIWVGNLIVGGIDLHESTHATYEKFPRLYSIAELFMWNAYSLLRDITTVVRSHNGELPALLPINGSQYDPTSIREFKTSAEKYREDWHLLSEFLSVATINVTALLSGESNVEDELIRGWRIVKRTGEIEFWNVLAVQLFLDVHHILRQEMARPYYEMRKTGLEIEKTIEQNIEFHKNLRMDSWTTKNDEIIEYLKMQINFCIHTDEHMAAMAIVTQAFPRLIDNFEEFFVPRRNPVYCGLWMYRLRDRSHNVGLAFASSWGAIVAACHLYHAVRHENLLEKPWKDMENLIKLQGESILGHRAPETAGEYMRRLLLVQGFSALSFAKDSRRSFQMSKSSVHRPRGLAWQAPLTRAFKERLRHNSPRHDFTPDELRNIMETTVMRGDDGFEVDNMRTSDVLFAVKLSRPSRSQAQRSAKDNEEAKRLQRLTIPALLKRMCDTLQGETFELTFDYLHMQRQCWALLRSIKNDSREFLLRMNTPDFLTNESLLPQFVGLVFMSADSVAQSTRSPQVKTPMFVKCANAIEALIDRGEGAVVQSLPDDDNGDEPEVMDRLLEDPMRRVDWFRLKPQLGEHRPDGSIPRLYVHYPHE